VSPAYKDAVESETTRQFDDATSQPLDPQEDLSGTHVLVVDDDLDTCVLMESLLKRCGAHVKTVCSATEAIESLRAELPDVIISDVGMPGIGGYEFMRQVRMLPPERGGKIPAVALTAYARGQDRLHALRAGYQMHVAKPIELAELVATVASLTERTSDK
jgi:CheY-like chemotaxis protein